MIKHILFFFSVLILASCQIDAPKYNLGKGFYVTYVDLPTLRGVYYQRQNINGNISVKSVKFDDSLILVMGYRLPKKSNYPDTSVRVYYGIVKDRYRNHPAQTQSDGYLDSLNEFQFKTLSLKLKKPICKEWQDW